MSGLILVSHNQHQSSTLASIYDRILISTGVFPVGIDLDDVLTLQESNSCQLWSSRGGRGYRKIPFSVEAILMTALA